MLTERQVYTLDDSLPKTISVDEILESYEIKGLNLSDLQEQYVDTVDNYEQQLKDMEDKHEDLINTISSLEETVSELKTTIEDNNSVTYTKSDSTFFV